MQCSGLHAAGGVRLVRYTPSVLETNVVFDLLTTSLTRFVKKTSIIFIILNKFIKN